MKTLETLYFPDTAIFSTRQEPLFLLFPTVNIIQPVDKGSASASKDVDIFMDSRFCHDYTKVHTPHPLGEDRQRFLYLINDIQNRKDDYAAQLSNLTLASMSAPVSSGEDSKNQILSSLLDPGQTLQQDMEQSRAETLWHARLVLAIAELLDREEDEVARAMDFLEESETDLFDRLKGEMDDDEAEQIYNDPDTISARQGQPRPDSIAKRMRAWFRFVDGAPLPHCPIWATSRQEVVDILLENHEKIHGDEPQHMASIPLPGRTAGNQPASSETIAQFHELFQDQLGSLVTMLTGSATTIAQDKSFLEAVGDYTTALDSRYPKEHHGRTEVHFYRCRGPLSDYSGTRPATPQGEALLAFFSL